MDKFHHVIERRSREEDFVHALAAHNLRIVMSDCAAAAAKDFDVVRSLFVEKIDNLRKEFDVPAVVTRDADGTHVLLNGRAHDITNRTMITKINDLDPVPDEFQVDSIDRAVMPVANGDRGQNSNR